MRRSQEMPIGAHAGRLALRIRGGKYWRTTTFRLTALFSCLFAVGVVFLLGVIYWQTAGYMTRQVDFILKSQIRTDTVLPRAELPRRISEAVADDARHIYYVGLFTRDGTVISGNLPRPLAGLASDGLVYAMQPDDSSGVPSGISIRAIGVELDGGQRLIIARDVAQLDEIRRIIVRALAWWGSLTVVLGIATGLAMSVRPMRRVAEIHAASRRIMLGDIRHRLPVAGRRDELDLLAGIVNGMLDEIERLVTEVKGVCDTIAHDLRTPLTRLRGQLYRIRQTAGDTDPHRVLLDGAISETDALLVRFRALLRISEIEDVRRRTGFTATDLSRIVGQLADLYEPLAEDRLVALRARIEANPRLICDGELLFEAFSNLVDNAIKFSPPSAVVEIRLRSEEAGPVIEIADQGPGIPPREREAILTRFYRGSQVRDVPGHGLGLSIVAAILRLHGFSLAFEEIESGGTRAVVRCWSGDMARD